MKEKPRVYLDDGTRFRGKYHILPDDGNLYAGKTHGSVNVRLYLFEQLPPNIQQVILSNGDEEKKVDG
jgi:hypothetical protein